MDYLIVEEMLVRESAIRELLSALVSGREILERLQWDRFGVCPICYGYRDAGHEEECQLGEYLKRMENLRISSVQEKSETVSQYRT